MKVVSWFVVCAALALSGMTSGETHAQPKKTTAVAPAKAADVAILIGIAEARSLPAGLAESSPELAKVVSLVASGKTKAALALVKKYAKANKDQLDEAGGKLVASFIVRRALLVPNKTLYAAADQLRFVKQGKAALAKYEATLDGKAGMDEALAFALNTYTEGADAVTVSKKMKKVTTLRKEIELSMKKLQAQEKRNTEELKKLMRELIAIMEMLSAMEDAMSG